MKRTTSPDVLALIQLIQAYNRGEIALEQWMDQTRAVALAVIAHYTDGVGTRSATNDADSKKAS